MPRVALLTDVATGSLDEDHEPLRAALAAIGVTAELLAWDDPAFDPVMVAGRYMLVVIRSPWDYPLHAMRYVEALERLGHHLPVLNRPELVRWNIDKRYLAELESAGIAIAPTHFVTAGEGPDAAGDAELASVTSLCAAVAAGGELVVKPSVSAGSRDTARYRASQIDAAVAHVRRLNGQGRTAMVQPYLHAVERNGETALVYLDGAFSHALRKGPLLRLDARPVEGLFAVEEMSAREPTAAQRAMGDAVLELVGRRFGAPLYARVDLLDGDDGDPVVLEVELNEPSLFHAHAPGSAERFARAIAARL